MAQDSQVPQMDRGRNKRQGSRGQGRREVEHGERKGYLPPRDKGLERWETGVAIDKLQFKKVKGGTPC